MDEFSELKVAASPAELAKLEQSDLCVTLYTIWDTLRYREKLGGKHFFTCKNDSCVPDAAFEELARSVFPESDFVVDRGEVFLLAQLPLEQFRETVAKSLYVALESL